MTQFTVITGLPGSGKTTVSSALGKIAELPVVNLGDIVWTAVKRAGLQPQSRPHAGELFVARFRPEELGRLAAETSWPHPHVILDGLRLEGSLRYLEETANCVRLVAVVAPENERLRRLERLGQADQLHSPFDSSIMALQGRAAVVVDNGAQVTKPTIFSDQEAQAFADAVLGSCTSSPVLTVSPWVTRAWASV